MLLKTQEVCSALGIVKNTVSKMVKRGQLTPVNQDPHYYLFNANEVETLKKTYVKFNAVKK